VVRGHAAGSLARTVGSTIPRQESQALSRANLEDVVSKAWWQVLGTGLHRLNRHNSASGTGTVAGATGAVGAEIAVAASLPMFGANSLVVVLRASRGVATDAAVSLLGLHREELAPGDIDDAFASLVNAIGSGLCDVLPDVTLLGTPVVVQGSAVTTAVPSARMTCDTSLRSGGGRVHVSLWRPRVQRLA
jgi:hypothetical protein